MIHRFSKYFVFSAVLFFCMSTPARTFRKSTLPSLHLLRSLMLTFCCGPSTEKVMIELFLPSVEPLSHVERGTSIVILVVFVMMKVEMNISTIV